MELRQLVYFEAVARHGGFTRAAEHLRVAQPAVSAQIRRLESELGAELLRRTTRRVALTPAGELFLTRVRRILSEVDAARDEVSPDGPGRVVVGATEMLGGLDLPGALASFHRRRPGVVVEVRSGLIAGLLAALDAGETDLVAGPIHDDLPGRFTAVPLTTEQIVLITPPEGVIAVPEGVIAVPAGRAAQDPAGRAAHGPVAAAAHGPVAVGELAGERFVCLPPGSGLRAILESAAAAAGFRPRVTCEAAGPAGVRALVAAGLGVALVARSSALAPGPPVDVREVGPAPPHPPIGLIRRRGHQPSAAALACHDHLVRRWGGPKPG